MSLEEGSPILQIMVDLLVKPHYNSNTLTHTGAEKMKAFRPKCINHGCIGLVVPMEGRITDPNPRWRVHCGHCQAASYGKWPHRPGVTPFKTNRCSNIDRRLGFACLINWKLAGAEGRTVKTDVDHKNGNPNDNRPRNLQELCGDCHYEKGRRSGDFNNQRRAA